MAKTKEQIFAEAWRQSDFYPWIMQLLDEEINSSYVKEQVVARSQAGEPMDDAEIGQATRIEVQAALRLQAIKERIE